MGGSNSQTQQQQYYGNDQYNRGGQGVGNQLFNFRKKQCQH